MAHRFGYGWAVSGKYIGVEYSVESFFSPFLTGLICFDELDRAHRFFAEIPG